VQDTKIYEKDRDELIAIKKKAEQQAKEVKE